MIKFELPLIMDNSNSPNSFSEDEVFFRDIPSEWFHPLRFLQEIKNSMEKDLNTLRISREAAISDINNPKETIELSKEVERLKQRESELIPAISVVKQSLAELSLKKSFAESVHNDVSEEELTVLLKEVVALEKENEMKIEEMKQTKRQLVGKMCFYKEYLDMYIDVLAEDSYKIYLRKCHGRGESRPKEWLRIQTDNFRDYLLHEISLPEGSDEWLEFMKLYEKGIHLRTLIYKARKFFCTKRLHQNFSYKYIV